MSRLIETYLTLPFPSGTGEKLGDIPRTSYQIAKMKPADLKPLHAILFDRPGKVGHTYGPPYSVWTTRPWSSRLRHSRAGLCFDTRPEASWLSVQGRRVVIPDKCDCSDRNGSITDHLQRFCPLLSSPPLRRTCVSSTGFHLTATATSIRGSGRNCWSRCRARLSRTLHYEDEEFNRLSECRNSNFTNSKLKVVCGVLDLEKKGTHSDLIHRIMNFLLAPKNSGKVRRWIQRRLPFSLWNPKVWL